MCTMTHHSAFEDIADKSEHDLNIFEKQMPEDIDWFKADLNKSIWPAGCMQYGRSFFQKKLAHYEFDAQTRVLLVYNTGGRW